MTAIVPDGVEKLGFDPARLDRLSLALERQVDKGSFPGISVAVTRHDQPVFTGTFGVQDPATGAPLPDDAIFRIASMTKPVTGVALLLLYEEGVWQLDDPVEAFVPEFASLQVLDPSGTLVPPDHPMTMRELVTNTGGIGGDVAGVSGQFGNGPGNEVRRLYVEARMGAGTIADMVTKIAQLPLASHPGTRFQYGLSQDVQGRIVELLSGTTLDAFFESRIFGPLRMDDTAFAVPVEHADRLVSLTAYGPSGGFVPSVLPPESTMGAIVGSGERGVLPMFLSGGAGLYSTRGDYLRFVRMLANRGRLDDVSLLAPSTVDIMASDLLPPGVPVSLRQVWAGCGYGVNVGVINDPGRATLMGGPVGRGTFHWSGAHGTWFWVDPERDLTVVGMVNLELSGIVHMGAPHPAPDLRSLSRSMVYQALTEPGC